MQMNFVIDDSAFGFCSPELVIKGSKGSKAEIYAAKKGLRFEAMKQPAFRKKLL